MQCHRCVSQPEQTPHCLALFFLLVKLFITKSYEGHVISNKTKFGKTLGVNPRGRNPESTDETSQGHATEGTIVIYFREEGGGNNQCTDKPITEKVNDPQRFTSSQTENLKKKTTRRREVFCLSTHCTKIGLSL